MITPTVGRVVWFTPARDDAAMAYSAPYPAHSAQQPCAAIVAYVWHDRMVNLAAFDHNGGFHARTSVPLLQDDDPKPEGGYFATWMPYQKGHAAKYEAAEAKLAEAHHGHKVPGEVS